MSLRIGLVYDRFGDAPPPPDAPPDWDAEYEPEATVVALEDAVRRLGHTPVRIGNVPALLDAFRAGPLRQPPLALDAAVTIAESYGSRNREAHAPILLELAGVPCLGSDALALSVSLDKHLTKTVVRAAGVAVPAGVVLAWGEGAAEAATASPEALAFPLIVKPRYEGTAKGIAPSSRVETPEALRVEAARQHALYRQDLVAEAFVDGAEFTVGVVGTGASARALPPLQRAVEVRSGIGLHALDDGLGGDGPGGDGPGDDGAADWTLGGDLSPALDARLAHAALAAHRALECADFSRSDFRVDPAGTVWFIEINPLPTFAPDGTFAILAELDGRPYAGFLADVLGAGLARLGVA